MIKKINKIGKMGRIISKIGQVFLIIAMIVCTIVGVLFCTVTKEKASIYFTNSNQAFLQMEGDFSEKIADLIGLDQVESTFRFGEQTYQLVDEKTIDNPTDVNRVVHIHNLKWAIVVGVVVCAVYYSVLHCLGKICQALEVCETPFTEHVSKGLERLAYAMIFMVIANEVGPFLMKLLVLSTWDMTIHIDLAIVLLILCIFLLVQIFKYGTMLQIESDETL